MKITGLKPVLVNGGYINWVFVRVETDVPGLIGWGESSLEWKTNAVAGAIRDLEPLVLGQDPTRIERLWQLMHRGAFYRGGIVVASAMSGIDQACWDILGKSLNQPVYRLLGGAVRDRVRLYGHLTGDGIPRAKSQTLGEIAQASLVDGLTALKCGPSRMNRPMEGAAAVKASVAEIAEIRRAIGDGVDLMVDLHGRCSPALSVEIGKALEGLGLLFLEEPCLPYSVSGMKKVADQVRIPIAAGERLATRWEFEPLIASRAVEVLQPDPSHCGGISEARRIAALAETHYMSMAFHNPLSHINTQACLHLGMATPNFLIQEVIQRHHSWRYEVVGPALEIKDGYAHPGDRPGLGVEVNEAECAKHPPIETRQPEAVLVDGSVTDW
ncbi:MAG: galactonate dehydratase [Candidatus Coatesbacteria bacterium]